MLIALKLCIELFFQTRIWIAVELVRIYTISLDGGATNHSVDSHHFSIFFYFFISFSSWMRVNPSLSQATCGAHAMFFIRMEKKVHILSYQRALLVLHKRSSYFSVPLSVCMSVCECVCVCFHCTKSFGERSKESVWWFQEEKYTRAIGREIQFKET